MADYISGGIHFTGIGNGTDFSSIVDKLKNVESIPMNRMKLWKADWNKRYEAFGTLISTVRDAKTKLADLNNPQKFLAKLGSSSNENVLSVKAGANAVDGTHSIEVKQLASNAIWASTATYSSKSTSINTTNNAQDFIYTYKGSTRTLSIPAGTTLESFTNMVNQDRGNPGVKVSIIQTAGGYTFQVQGKESGAAADLTIQPSDLDQMGGGSTTWLASAATANPAASFSSSGAAVKNYTYTLTMADGTTQSIDPIDGDMTQQDLVTAINAKVPGAASFSGGKLVLNGVQKVEVADGSATSSTTGTPTAHTAFSGALGDALGTPGTNYTYTLTLADGTTKNFTLDGEKTRQNLIDEIKAAGYTVTVAGDDASGYTMDIAGATNFADTGGTFTSADPTWEWSKTASASATIQSGVVPRNLAYSFTMADGTAKTVSITSDKSMNDLVAAINTQLGAGTAQMVTKEGQQFLQLSNVFNASGQGVSGQVASSSNWSIRRSCDAIFMVDNWPQEMTSSSNNVSQVLEGVTLTLKDVGKAQISVAADHDSVKANIQTVLDTLNSVIKKVQDLTKWDSQKQTASTNPKDPNYSPSQWDQEKGSVLTGNYGVQLFNTRVKSLVSGTPPGFTSIKGNDIFSGDFVAALSQIGIKTCTEEGNPNFGMFMIAPSSNNLEMQEMDKRRFDDALKNHLDDVISFFAADDEGSSSSADFRYYQHIKGMTKPGTYSISYSVNGGVVSNVRINGALANESDLEAGVYTVASAGDASGMSIKIDNLTDGNHSGNVSIKQGKIRQMEDFFTSELVYYAPDPKEPTIGQKNGALMILQTNYKQIMDNIDKKIEREQTRLTKWERTQRLAFSRLETLLGKYERNQQSLSSQMSQLAKGSG